MTDKGKFILLLAGGLLLAAALGSGGYMAAEYWLDSANAQAWAPVLASAEAQYGLPAGLLSRIAYQESHFRSDIIDGTTASPAGALGMMQLMPQYFSSVRVPVPFTGSDTQAQINQAAQLLNSLFQEFGDWSLAIAAYNAGSGTVQNYVNGSLSSLPTETQNYVTEVTADLPNLANA